MPQDSDDEEESIAGAYEGGHWVWHDEEESLVYVRPDLSELVTETVTVKSVKAPTGTVEFKNDLDVLEQMRYRKRYQRKVPYGEPDVITLQDIKDLALYTAPVQILSSALINMLHLNTTEKFLRALILYCQYYLQIVNAMNLRKAESETKIRTPHSEEIESEFESNLSDLRLLVAKEYFTILTGGSDTAAFHHMGPIKKYPSLSNKDARQFETLLRMSVQIVWIALGRSSFNQLELEINRLFKGEIFNSVEHTLNTGYLDKMTKEERAVLMGVCRSNEKKLYMRSPLENGVFCERNINFRIFGIGVIKYPELPPRLQYMLIAISSPEEYLLGYNVTVGILGMERSKFDIMLNMIAPSAPTSKSDASSKYSVNVSVTSRSSARSTTKPKKDAGPTIIYPDIYLPPWEQMDGTYPDHFPDAPDTEAEARRCDKGQRLRWLARLQRLLHPPRTSLKTTTSKILTENST